MRERYDAVVVGGGVMGTAAALALAGRGMETALLERFEIGHARGSSHGATRIFRLTYEHPLYVRMAALAREAWAGLEEAAGERLIVRTGGLSLGEVSHASAAALETSGAPFEWLSVGEAAERWPDLRVPAGVPILHEPDGGICFADRTVAVQARLAREAGVAIHEGTRAEALVPGDGSVEVLCEGRDFAADVAVVAVGGWTAPLLATAGVELPVTPSLEQVSYHRLASGRVLPTVIDWAGAPSRIGYAVPDPGSPGSFKSGLHRTGPPVDAETRTFEIDPDRLRDAKAWVTDHFEGVSPDGEPETCLYANTPDQDFVLDRIGALVIASPCSGHGFKFAPLVGSLVADLATGAAPAVDLTPFRATRDFRSPLLTERAEP